MKERITFLLDFQMHVLVNIVVHDSYNKFKNHKNYLLFDNKIS